MIRLSESLIDAVNDFETSGIKFNSDRMHQHAAQFSKDRFQAEIQAYVEPTLGRIHLPGLPPINSEPSESPVTYWMKIRFIN